MDPRSGERSHAGNTYFTAASKRPNLKSAAGVLVERVLLFDKDDGSIPTARRVQYVQDGITKFTTARKETILCCGAFQSPQLLELSRIGPAELLNSLEIDVTYNNPYVGGKHQQFDCD